jgi:Fe2+ or Zn2+ uptake regulation protein
VAISRGIWRVLAALDRSCRGGDSCSVKSGESHHSPHGGKKLKAPDADRLRADLEAYMTRRGLRSTEQRRVIIGVVQEHKFGDGFTRYELSDDDAHHDHLICMECGKITEFEEDAIEELQAKIAKRHGFLVRAHKHEMYGVCADCQAKARAARR